MRPTTITALAVTAAALAVAPAANAAGEDQYVDVQFTKGAGAQLRDGRLQGRVAGFGAALAKAPGAKLQRLFHADESDLTAAQNRFFRIRVPAGRDPDALIRSLRHLGSVAVAERMPEAAPLPTADYTSLQGYRLPRSSGGVGAESVQDVLGGTGAGVGIIDVEFDWNRSHEDLSQARASGALIANGTPCDPWAATKPANDINHGTAVLGEMAGDPNSFGVSGLSPASRVRMVNAARLFGTSCAGDLATAIDLARRNSARGDVILIEQQITAEGDTQERYLPVEFRPEIWAAIRAATDAGITVIEPAGNGNQNLGSAAYASHFASDSGAIMVGAGNPPGCTSPWGSPPARARLGFSDYGSRVDVQGWGECVATTGYGDLNGVGLANNAYTETFSGTSSASPIVASSAALLSAVAKARGTTLTPAQVRSLLKSTGQAQSSAVAGHIGPLPDVQAAVKAMGPKVADGGHSLSGTVLGATTLPVRQAWSAAGATTYDVFLKTDTGDWVRQSATAAAAVFDLERNHSYRFAARARDAAGVWGDWTYGKAFSLGEYQEDYSATNPLYTGTWTRAGFAPASSGFVKYSATAGDRVTFTFTGTEAAWIGSRATNRGQARVYVDGVYSQTVDLHSASTVAQAIAFRAAWATSGTHTITIEVVGTAGHPKVDVDAFVRLR